MKILKGDDFGFAVAMDDGSVVGKYISNEFDRNRKETLSTMQKYITNGEQFDKVIKLIYQKLETDVDRDEIKKFVKQYLDI